MYLAIRLVDLGSLLSLAALWGILGTFVFTLYRWLWRTEHAAKHDDGI